MWPAQQQQQPTFRGRIETVSVPVTVFDPDGGLVTELSRGDFTILDNGRPQDITAFSSGLQPLRAVALVDVSASMMPAIDLALLAAEQFVIRLQPEDRASVGLFSQRISLTERFTADRDVLLNFLRQDLPFSNPTRLFDAVNEAISQLQRESGRRVVVVFTDGCDTASATTWPVLLQRIYAEDVMVHAVMFRPRLTVTAPPARTLSFGSAPRAGRAASRPAGGCTLHHHLELSPAVAPSDFLRVDDPRWTAGSQLVDTLTAETGGGRLQLTAADDVNTMFTSLMRELHYMYLLGFSPPAHDGKVHALTVRVADRTLVVRARQHYLAPPPPQ